MNTSSLGIKNRLRYASSRIRGFNAGSVWTRAKESAQQHHKWAPAVMVDMLWSAGVRNTAFQDYVDWDFPILSRAERATYMTHSISTYISEKYNHPDFREVFHHKINFNKAFDKYLGREWLDVDEHSVDEVREFVERHQVVMGKVPVSDSGHGVERYRFDEIVDWEAFRSRLMTTGQTLLEVYITQHPDLAKMCPGTANTTRVTTFFDGKRTHILSMAQKFGRGQASDQQTFGGFYTMLDDNGKSRGPGYDSHHGVFPTHPESGESIIDFVLPLADQVLPYIDQVARVIPQIQYVGWDIVMTAAGPVLIEGNWGAGVYDNKPSVTGIRTGSLPRFRAAIGF